MAGRAHDVSHELRGFHGRWTRGGAALHRMAQEAVDSQSQESVLTKVQAIEPGKGRNINGHWVERPASHGHQYQVKLKTADRGKRDVKVYATPEEAAHAVHTSSHKQTEAGPGSPPPASPPQTAKEWRKEKLREIGHTPQEEAFRRSATTGGVHHPKSLDVKVQAPADQKKKMRQQVLKATTKQAEITPDLVDRTDIAVTKSPHGRKGTSTLASHTGQRNTLHVKPEVLIGDNTQAVLDYNRGGWWVPTDHQHDLSMNVLTHEFGHGVHGELNRLGIIKANRHSPVTYDEEEMNFWKGLSDAIGSRPPREFTDKYGTPTINVSNWHMDNQDAIKKAVSRYAGHNLNEMFAELWTEYRLSANPRAPAKFFGDYITNYLKLHEKLIA